MKVLIIAPHPDDEVLGLGATIHRMVDEGNHVTVAIVTKGWQPLFSEQQVRQVRTEAQAANKHLGTQSLRFLDLPVTKLNSMAEHEINAHFATLVDEEAPDWVFLPFPGDLHEDHRQVFNACQVALRPVNGQRPIQRILCYETVSETHWATPQMDPMFNPQLFVDVTGHLDEKLHAMSLYASQIRSEPDARSIGAVEALARWRGSVVGVSAAEAFTVIRECWPAGERPL